MKTALILEGGAMRGMFTAGILDVLIDSDFRPDVIVGTSAGALFGVNFLSGQKGRVIRYNKRFNRERKYMGFLPLIKEGNVVSTDYAYNKVPHELDVFDDGAFIEAAKEIPFYAVATNIETGKPEYMRIESVFRQMDTLRASGSLPYVSRPVEIDGVKYLDGGISDSIPFEWARDVMGCDKLVVILTRDKNYRKEPASKRMADLFYKKYPSFRESLLARYKNYNDSTERLCKLEEEGKAFVIRPERPLDIGRMEKNPKVLQAVYDIGVKAGEDNKEKIFEYLNRV